MIDKIKSNVTPNPKQWEDSSPENGSKSSAPGLGVDTHTLSKKVFIETYGCQMNSYDSELVRSILAKADYALVPTEDEADVVLLNTCAVREHAHRKIYGRIHEIHHKRRSATKTGGQNTQPLVGILGCMATNLRTDLLENRKLKIDFIAGPDSYKRLPDLIRQAQETGKKQYDLTLSEFETYSDIFPAQQQGINPSTRPSDSLRVNAWIAVMRGCNNFCTFCVVPYTRGRERSRSVENIVEETRRLAGEGFKQVTLLGQNVNSYFWPLPEEVAKTPSVLVSTEERNQQGVTSGADFADLLEAVSAVEGIARVRFTSPHPKDFPDKLLDVVARNPKVCKHIHLPLQAGSNRILELMNRTYTKEEFLALVEKIRRLIPGVALSTDVIVGFCSETDAEFEETLDVLRQAQFDAAFTFKYSQRKGTIAERKYKDDVAEEIKTERIVRLNALQKKISLKKNRAHIGETHQILIEHKGAKRSAGAFHGRTDGNTLVTLTNNGHHTIGECVTVKITDASANTLKGVAIS